MKLDIMNTEEFVQLLEIIVANTPRPLKTKTEMDLVEILLVLEGSKKKKEDQFFFDERGISEIHMGSRFMQALYLEAVKRHKSAR